MNRKQRESNRANARRLADNAVICPRCGGRGKHFVVDPIPQLGGDASGWLCQPSPRAKEGE